MAASSRFLRSAVLGLGSMPRASISLVSYGIACKVWQILVLVTICVVAIAILHGIGILLAAVTIAGAIIPQFKAFRSSRANSRAENVSWAWWRPALVLGFVLIALFAPLFPPPPASALICFSELDRVRVKCPGFVEEILVKDGQRVEKGDVLFRLST